jgi:hypothetical protein
MPSSLETDPRTDVLPFPEKPSQTFLTKCYLAYIVLGGDLHQTALACNVDPKFIEAYACKEDWKSRLEATADLCGPGARTPAEVERLLNRTALYVQAQRIRRIIDAVLTEVEEAASGDDKTLLELFTVTTKESVKIDLKPLTDLTTAALKLSQMASGAMCDTASERVKRMSHSQREGEDSLALGKEVLDGLSNIPANAPDSETVALEGVRRARAQLKDKAKA